MGDRTPSQFLRHLRRLTPNVRRIPSSAPYGPASYPQTSKPPSSAIRTHHWTRRPYTRTVPQPTLSLILLGIHTSFILNGIQLWGTASTSNINILERFQSKALRMIVDASWYVPNTVIRRDLHILTVKRRNPPLQLSIQCKPQRTSK
jgi:hypothetical protein